MAVELDAGAISRFRGLSSDTKPTYADAAYLRPLRVGSRFEEVDTGHRYVWGGSWPWVRQTQTIDTAFQEQNELLRDILEAVKANRYDPDQI